MNNYTIKYEKSAIKFLQKQPKNQQQRIIKSIESLPYVEGIKRLIGYKNTYRIRIGDYRAIYTIENDILLIKVVNIGNRGQIYNKH
ncbi:MAG: type II toxin-antitoxin system RelE/ParE family toxin [Oscillospiraceae bacterium]